MIPPDEPHAYISGDLMEAMVSSDNVVRGGLTPKLKDKDTLVKVSFIFVVYLFLDANLLIKRAKDKRIRN